MTVKSEVILGVHQELLLYGKIHFIFESAGYPLASKLLLYIRAACSYQSLTTIITMNLLSSL